MRYTIQKLAHLANISVRTLHYYDEIGLLKPSSVGQNGYRYYEDKEVLRLQQILFFRELEFPLENIKSIINNPQFNEKQAFEDHKKMLILKKERIEKLIETLNKSIENATGGENMTSDDMFGGFTKKQMEEYQKEAEERWGNTDAWRQSKERTKHFTKADYDRLAKEGEEWTKKLADLKDNGLTPESLEIQKMIGEHYNALRTFYEPNYEMYKGLGQMYVNDSRFGAYYEKFSKGLAVFMRDAMVYFANKNSE